MKKLKLQLDGKDMLSKEQMREIAGGQGIYCQIVCNGVIVEDEVYCDEEPLSDCCIAGEIGAMAHEYMGGGSCYYACEGNYC